MAAKARAALDALRQLYGRGDFDAVLIRAEQHLKKHRSANDPHSRLIEAARVAALIQLGRSVDAIAHLDDLERAPIDPRVQKFVSFARPYLAWTTNVGVSDAVESVHKLPGDYARKLEAQLLYRLGRYQDAAAVYRSLYDKERAVLAEKKKPAATSRWTLRTSVAAAPITAAELETLTQNVNELATNLMATLVLCDQHEEAMAIKEGLQPSYELEYNSTCASIGAKDFGMADICLELAESLLREIVVAEESDDLEEEMAPIKVQRAYLKHLSGNVGEAKGEYATVVAAKSADAASLAVAANNLTVALGQLAFDKEVQEIERRKVLEASASTGSETDGAVAEKTMSDKKAEKDRHDGLSDGLKKMRATSGARVEAKLTNQQRRAMARNRSILLVQMGRLDGCKAELDRLKGAFPGDPINPLIEAALTAKRSDLTAADAVLEAAGDSDAIRAARVQLAEENGDRLRAAELLLELFPGKPAAVATAAAIFEEAGETERAIKLLSVAADGAKPTSIGAKKALSELLIRKEKHADAAVVLQQLLQHTPNDSVVLAQLVVATSYFDAKKAESLAERLPPLPSSALDETSAAELENLPPPKRRTIAARAKTTKANGVKAIAENAGEEKKKKRKRKKRLPKNYDPDGPPPDPERWLPKTMRSGYKKKKRRNEVNFRGSQGADAASAEVAAAKNAEKSAARVAAAAAEAGPQAPTSNRPKGAKKKKKNRR